MTCTVVSSSGKVLMAGGYLVLDANYSGVVISTSSRFYTVIRRSEATVKNEIHARSPQFLDANWRYAVQFTDHNVFVEQTGKKVSTNKFVELAIQCTLSLAAEVRGIDAIQDSLSNGITIDIVGDNDFYSQRAQLESLGLPRVLESLSNIPPFSKTGVRLSEVHKTGLGSSAALITSLVSALLLHFSVLPRASFSEVHGEGRRLAHNVAQYVHCFAQGKVGSGFDVSAAVFGSQVYTRFDPAVIEGVMDYDKLRKGPLLPILSASSVAWTHNVQPFKLPPLTRLMLADVDAGSDTPSLVGKVLKWRRDNSSESHRLWTTLDEQSQLLVRNLTKLSELEKAAPRYYSRAVKHISTLEPSQWLANPIAFPEEVPIVTTFYEVHQCANTIRKLMRQMGEAAAVPIEPPEQTKLLDACVTQAGVVGAGVPGAGGYDAIWVLITDPFDCIEQERPIRRVESVWSAWEDMNVSPLATVESATQGVRVENLKEVPGLLEVLSQP